MTKNISVHHQQVDIKGSALVQKQNKVNKNAHNAARHTRQFKTAIMDF